jgi:hypothetical protein
VGGEYVLASAGVSAPAAVTAAAATDTSARRRPILDLCEEVT